MHWETKAEAIFALGCRRRSKNWDSVEILGGRGWNDFMAWFKLASNRVLSSLIEINCGFEEL